MSTLKGLRANINNMGCLAHSSLSKIEGIAKLALYALETPGGVRDLTSLGYALQAIANEASVGKDSVSAEAEESGEAYQDVEGQIRFDAMWKGRKDIGAAAVALTPVEHN